MVPCLEVYDSSTVENRHVGTARFNLRHGSLSTTFVYADQWLDDEAAYAIDPQMPLLAKTYHCAGIPGAFSDSSPDRWGKTLIQRNLRLEAEKGNTSFRKLDEVDYLIGVHDLAREGSLRFLESGQPAEMGFLSQSTQVPPLVQLPKLIRASKEVANESGGLEEIKLLLDAGSGSLGGARPKATVRDEDKILLAKFSHPGDIWDVMAWEKVALDMAQDIGIPTPKATLVRIGEESVLLLERFDRQHSLLEGQRIPYMSGMTVLEGTDGEARDYAELAEKIVWIVADVSGQLKDFFTRVVFSVAIGNTDDHLRNWGFLRIGKQWQLSPLFDVNPNPYENATRTTRILGEGGQAEVQALKDLAIFAQLDASSAFAIVSKVLDVVSNWKHYARKNKCKESDINLMEPLFTRKIQALRAVFIAPQLP